MNAIAIRNVTCTALVAGMLLVTGARAQSVNKPQVQWGDTVPALQIQVDEHRNRIWVLNLDGITLYDRASGKQIKRIDLPEWVVVRQLYSCPPALVLTPSGGSVLVTSNILPILWEIDGTTLAVRQIRLALDTDSGRDIGFTRLAFGGDGQLVGVSSTGGSVWRIDLGAAKANKLRVSTPAERECVQARSASGHPG